jgi:hypothetical protein
MRLPPSVVLPEPPAELSLAPIDPADDPRLEPRFDLIPGQLASARRRPSRFVLQLVRDGDAVGLGVFMPSVPGAFPFRLAEPALAAAFLALLRPLARPDAPFLQVSAESDDALAAAVLALGAHTHLELLHMRGRLP